MCEVEYEALRRDSSDMAKISALRAVLCCEVQARVANHARARASLSTKCTARAAVREQWHWEPPCCSFGECVFIRWGVGWSAQTHIADLVKHAAPFT